jgi:tetratricopeptide (TPR) repeat protein
MEHKEEKNQGLDLDTTLIETSHKVEKFYHTYKKQITTGIIAIVALVGGYVTFKMFYIEPKEKEAQAAMYQAQIWFEKDSFNLALNGLGENAGFIAIADEFGLTKSGKLAHYYAGVCYMRKGEFQNAIDMLDGFSTDNDLVGPLATGLKGDAYVELNDIEKGASLYMKAAGQSHNKITAPIFLKKAGIAFEELKSMDNAVRAYEKIKNEYPESSEAQDIDKFIARATAANAN